MSEYFEVCQEKTATGDRMSDENAVRATQGETGKRFPLQVFNALLSQQEQEAAILAGNSAVKRPAKKLPERDPVSRPAQGQPEHDAVNHPAHYTNGSIECIDAIQAAVTDLVGPEAWLTGTILKYIWRWKWKNGLEDLRKAQFYLDRLVKVCESEQQKNSAPCCLRCDNLRNETADGFPMPVCPFMGLIYGDIEKVCCDEFIRKGVV